MATVTQIRRTNSPYASFRLHLPEDPIAVQQRAHRQKASGKFPVASVPYDIPSFQEKDEAYFRKYSDKGERRADAPNRQNTPVVDPISGFTSVGADAEDGNYRTMEPFVNSDHRPQSAKPYGRPITSPIPELRSQNAPWETRNKDLEHFHEAPSQVPMTRETRQLIQKVPVGEMLKNKEWRDAVAMRAFYTSQTQKLYDGVDWANKLPPSLPPPPTTVEVRPDMVSYRFAHKRYDPQAELWQELGGRPHSWDFVQTRNGHHVYGPIDFCSPSKKVGHIPGYMGHTPGTGERDHPKVRFIPTSLVRTHQPRYTDTAKKGNIPGYSGCVLFSAHHPAHSREARPKISTMQRTHRELKVPKQINLSPFNRTSYMSKMVTLTHPFNPFNKLE